MPVPSRVSIIVLNWNRREDALACLASLGQVSYPQVGTVLVDNGSTDGSVEAVAARFPATYIIATGRNLGYVGGNNRGLAYALSTDADYVLLLNNDTVVEPGFLEPLIAYADAQPTVGMISPKIYLYDTPRHISFAGACFSPYGSLHHPGFGEPDPTPQDGPPVETVYVPGCALLARRQLVERIGLLNPDYYLLFEDVDWCFRARRLGYHSVLVPESKIWHKESQSFGGKASPRYLYYFTRNHLLFIRRNIGGRRRLKWLYYSLRGYRWHWKNFHAGTQQADPLRAKATALAVRDFGLGRLGERAYPCLRPEAR